MARRRRARPGGRCADLRGLRAPPPAVVRVPDLRHGILPGLRGYDAEYPASNRAVDDTAHQVLTSGGEPAFTQFGSSSGGWTAAGSVPYLPAQEDPYDGWSGNPVHSWSVKLTDGSLERAWPAVGDLRRITVVQRDGHGDWGGRVVSITLRGTGRAGQRLG